MSKIIIYDNKNILIANLDKTETRKKKQNKSNNKTNVYYNEYSAIFTKYKLIHSFSLKKQLKKIEKIIKFHKEEK